MQGWRSDSRCLLRRRPAQQVVSGWHGHSFDACTCQPSNFPVTSLRRAVLGCVQPAPAVHIHCTRSQPLLSAIPHPPTVPRRRGSGSGKRRRSGRRRRSLRGGEQRIICSRRAEYSMQSERPAGPKPAMHSTVAAAAAVPTVFVSSLVCYQPPAWCLCHSVRRPDRRCTCKPQNQQWGEASARSRHTGAVGWAAAPCADPTLRANPQTLAHSFRHSIRRTDRAARLQREHMQALRSTQRRGGCPFVHACRRHRPLPALVSAQALPRTPFQTSPPWRRPQPRA